MENRIKTLNFRGKRHLPVPTGPYTVACADIMTSYMKFGVFIRLYYPSQNEGVFEHYLQWPLWIPHKEYIHGYATRVGLPTRLYRKGFQLLVGELYIPAVWQAPLCPLEDKYPVIVFSHGLTGWRSSNSAICLELASQGFIVAAVEHRDRSASASFYKKQARMSALGKYPGCDLLDVCDGKWEPNPKEESLGPFCLANEWMLYGLPAKGYEAVLRRKQLRHRAEEVTEVVDLLEDLDRGRPVTNVLDTKFPMAMFRNQLDMKKCFFVGHSFGGATGIISMATDLRFKAGVLLDPWMFPFYEDQSCFSLVSRPFLCLLVKSFQTRRCLRLADTLRNMNSGAQFLVLRGGHHRDLCDAPFAPRWSISFSNTKMEKFSALDLAVGLILEYIGQHLEKFYMNDSLLLESLKAKHLLSEDYIAKHSSLLKRPREQNPL